jgi:hypothetical protein
MKLYVWCVMSASVTTLAAVFLSLVSSEPPKCVPNQQFPLSAYLALIGLAAGGLLGGLRVLREEEEQEEDSHA